VNFKSEWELRNLSYFKIEHNSLSMLQSNWNEHFLGIAETTANFTFSVWSAFQNLSQLLWLSIDAKIWSTSLQRGPQLYAENFLKSGTPEPRVLLLSRFDCKCKCITVCRGKNKISRFRSPHHPPPRQIFAPVIVDYHLQFTNTTTNESPLVTMAFDVWPTGRYL
jgi:hypothetical protein